MSDTVSVNPIRPGEETPTVDTVARQTAAMRVVFATAELSPVATVGGLAAAAAGLGAELRRRGVDVELVLPDYGNMGSSTRPRSDSTSPSGSGAATVRVGHLQRWVACT